jgi:predicted amidohydrolase
LALKSVRIFGRRFRRAACWPGGRDRHPQPSASNEQIGKAEYRRELVANQSARGLCVYAYASANPCESTTDTVFGGHMLIAEGGRILSENARFDTEGSLLLVDVDTQRMQHDRRNAGSFHQRLPWDPPCPSGDGWR